MINITFDSNVWEKIVTSSEASNDSFFKLKKLIINKKIQAYICEIAISLESIQKIERAAFWQEYEPRLNYETHGGKINRDGTTTIKGGVCFSSYNEKHPGLHPKLKEKLLLAEHLGFKVLRMTNLGTVRSPEIPQNMFVESTDIDSFWSYAQKLSDCADYIVELRCGSYEYDKFKNKYSSYSSSTFKIDDSEEKGFIKSIAEWVDGDSISAHYASRNTIFCTEDRAKGAGNSSVFSKNNRTKLEHKYAIKILSVNELYEFIGRFLKLIN